MRGGARLALIARAGARGGCAKGARPGPGAWRTPAQRPSGSLAFHFPHVEFLYALFPPPPPTSLTCVLVGTVRDGTHEHDKHLNNPIKKIKAKKTKSWLRPCRAVIRWEEEEDDERSDADAAHAAGGDKEPPHPGAASAWRRAAGRRTRPAAGRRVDNRPPALDGEIFALRSHFRREASYAILPGTAPYGAHAPLSQRRQARIASTGLRTPSSLKETHACPKCHYQGMTAPPRPGHACRPLVCGKLRAPAYRVLPYALKHAVVLLLLGRHRSDSIRVCLRVGQNTVRRGRAHCACRSICNGTAERDRVASAECGPGLCDVMPAAILELIVSFADK